MFLTRHELFEDFSPPKTNNDGDTLKQMSPSFEILYFHLSHMLGDETMTKAVLL